MIGDTCAGVWCCGDRWHLCRCMMLWWLVTPVQVYDVVVIGDTCAGVWCCGDRWHLCRCMMLWWLVTPVQVYDVVVIGDTCAGVWCCDDWWHLCRCMMLWWLVTPVQVDGSIAVWDLNESSALNELYTDSKGNGFHLRQPSYNTGCALHGCSSVHRPSQSLFTLVW